jgi:hypothetical protein
MSYFGDFFHITFKYLKIISHNIPNIWVIWKIHNWLALWNMTFILLNSWDDDPIWLSYFSEGYVYHHPDNIMYIYNTGWWFQTWILFSIIYGIIHMYIYIHIYIYIYEKFPKIYRAPLVKDITSGAVLLGQFFPASVWGLPGRWPAEVASRVRTSTA